MCKRLGERTELLIDNLNVHLSSIFLQSGPDVDWIVAGSGSVSPGTGRTRGQIIATSRSAQGRASR